MRKKKKKFTAFMTTMYSILIFLHKFNGNKKYKKITIQ